MISGEGGLLFWLRAFLQLALLFFHFSTLGFLFRPEGNDGADVILA